MDRPHVFTQFRQDRRELGCPSSERCDSCPKSIWTISRLGACFPTHSQLDAALCDSFKERVDLPLNFHPRLGFALSNTSTASSATVSTIDDSPTSAYFGPETPAVVGEGRFQSLTRLKQGQGEFEAPV